jgi:hypothetical protein
MRLPITLSDVTSDCEFLEDVFRLPRSAMLLYERFEDDDRRARMGHMSRLPDDPEFLLLNTQSPRFDGTWHAWLTYNGHPGRTIPDS